MTTVKISQLPALTGADTAATDVIPIVDVSGNITNKITREEFFKNIQTDVEVVDKIVHSGDTNTAIRFPAADTVTVETSGAERLRVDSSGNVGIGTATPDFQLHVDNTAGNATIGIIAEDASNSILYMGDQTSNTVAYIQYNHASNFMNFRTNSVDRMRIDSSGNVGIGTASPASIVGGTDTSPVLSIGGADSALTTGDKAGSLSFITNDSSYTGTYADGVTAEIASVATTSSGAAYGLAFYTGHVGNSRGERMRITSSGLGIGTTSPSEELHIRAAVPTFRLEDSDTSAYTNLVFNTGSFAIDIDPTGAGSSSVFTVDIDASERMRIDSSGNVGIGTSSPDAPLHLANGTSADFILEDSGAATLTAAQGKVEFQRSSNVAFGGLYVTDGTTDLNISTKFSTGFLTFGTDTGGERMRITSAGSVGIGTTSPSSVLHVRNNDAVLILDDANNGTGGTSYRPHQEFWADGTRVGSIGMTDSISLEIIADNYNSASINFDTGGSERMRITSTGNVGIGTSSPTNPLDVNADSVRIRTAQTPATSGAAGNQGEIAWDANYIYVCTATNTWKRVAIATW